jgi:hypothetical protein
MWLGHFRADYFVFSNSWVAKFKRMSPKASDSPRGIDIFSDIFSAMDLDVEDILAGAVGSVFGRLVLFVVVVWLGCCVGGAGIVAGSMVDSGSWRPGNLFFLWAGPLLLFSTWAFLNIPILFYFLMRFIRNDGDSYLILGIVIGMQALVVMLGWVRDFVDGWLPMIVAWGTCLLFLAMIGSGLWLVRQHLINLWARDIAMLRAENAQRRAERESEERRRMELEEDR